MMDAIIFSHFEKKKAWMASHVVQAQFPTQMSKLGLAYYQNQETIPEIPPTFPSTPSTQTFYLVDSHPLMVRYAATMAANWVETEREALLEFISQISLTDLPLPEDMEIYFYLGMQNAAPSAIAMVLRTKEGSQWVCGCYDVIAKTDELKKEMLAYLAEQHKSDLFMTDFKEKT
jgi:hypothetical protein